MKNNNNERLGLPSILTIIFVIAKLLGLITWSWWWLFSPILAVIGFLVGIILVALIASSS